MHWILDLGLGTTILAVSSPFQALALAQADIAFTIPHEGTVKFVVSGNTDGPFEDIILSWRNHYLNKPGTSWHNPEIPDWEVLEVGVPYTRGARDASNFFTRPTLDTMPVTPRHKLSPRRLYETKGVVFYGFWPFHQIHRYRFKWTEERVKADGSREPWRRDEMTSIMYVETFVYHVRLEGAEDSGGQPLDLSYLLSVRINNPYKARFAVTDWLERLTADSNNAAKIWVGQHTFSEITSEKHKDSDESGFVQALKKLNYNLPTEHEDKGAPEVIGVTVVASSLQQVEIAGSNRQALVEASTAVVVAERRKQATIIEAEGRKQAAILEGEGRAQAINAVYEKVKEFGDLGMFLSQLDAMKATGPGDKIIWANNPFIRQAGLDSILTQAGITPQMLIDFVRTNSSNGRPTTP